MPADANFCPNCRAPVPAGHQVQAAAPATRTKPTRGYLWTIALFPLAPAHLCILSFAILSLHWWFRPHTIMVFNICVACCLLVSSVFALIFGKDFKILQDNLNAEHAHKKLSKKGWVATCLLLPPVYLYRRASHTDGRVLPFCINLFVFAGSLATIIAQIAEHA
jgi:hypothetical protein